MLTAGLTPSLKAKGPFASRCTTLPHMTIRAVYLCTPCFKLQGKHQGSSLHHCDGTCHRFARMPTAMMACIFALLAVLTVADAVHISVMGPESGKMPVLEDTKRGSFLNKPVKKREGKHHVDSTIQKIVSRLTSQEMDEKYWLDSSSQPERPHQVLVGGHPGTMSNFHLHRHTKIVTIPMSAVRPRVQSPGSSRGMPPRMRIVEIDHSQRTMLQRIFRRAIHGADDSPKKKIFSVDLYGGIIGVGEYYSLIELGNKRIRVQVDTGSSTLAGRCDMALSRTCCIILLTLPLFATDIMSVPSCIFLDTNKHSPSKCQ